MFDLERSAHRILDAQAASLQKLKRAKAKMPGLFKDTISEDLGKCVDPESLAASSFTENQAIYKLPKKYSTNPEFDKLALKVATDAMAHDPSMIGRWQKALSRLDIDNPKIQKALEDSKKVVEAARTGRFLAESSEQLRDALIPVWRNTDDWFNLCHFAFDRIIDGLKKDGYFDSQDSIALADTLKKGVKTGNFGFIVSFISKERSL